jgi:hypothetical protein
MLSVIMVILLLIFCRRETLLSAGAFRKSTLAAKQFSM